MFRKTFFWLHLSAGLIAGLLIAMMAFTGLVQVFEKELIAWSERDVRQIALPANDAPRLQIDELVRRARETKPDRQPNGITVFAEPTAAVAVAFGRDAVYYANPYTGEIRKPASTRVSDFIHFMERLHRFLGLSEKSTKPVGEAITGATSATFLFLSLSGLYLWWPRNWSWRSVRAVTVFNLRLLGKARDFNWHNSIGFWISPTLILITLTALPMSYRCANNLLFRATGNEPPAQGPGTSSAITVPTPEPGTKKLGYDALLAAAQKEEPYWTETTIRLGNTRGSGSGNPRRENRPAPDQNPEFKSPDQNPLSESRASRPTEEPRVRRPESGEGSAPRGAQAVNIAIRTAGQWPLFSSTTLTLDPFTGAVLKKETFADQNAGRRLRTWARYLHTGEALGLPGKLLAVFATLGALVLVWTGFALSWHRFFSRRAA